MRRARLLLTGALGDFLPPHRRNVPFDTEFELPVGLRDLVQSAGVPHVEVGEVLVDGVVRAWSHRVDDGAAVVAHPRYPLQEPPEPVRFLTDAHLGRVTGYLRLVGIDVLHDPTRDDPGLVATSVAEDRILLTRDRQLLMTGALRRGTFVRSTDPRRRAVEIVDRFALHTLLRPFTRCMACNAELVDAGPEEVAGRVPAAVLGRHDRFRNCPGCGRVYWEGSHHERLAALVDEIAGRQ